MRWRAQRGLFQVVASAGFSGCFLLDLGFSFVKTKNKVVEPTNKAAAVETGMYLVGLNLFPVLLGIL